jgi:peptide/nickel transport system substrate-binding protein
MRFIASRWLAAIRRAILALIACAALMPLAAATRHPRYGGTLRVELRESAISLDPRVWKPGSLESAANEKIAALVFDRLVSLDNYGHFQPQLAVEWSHDATFRRWQIRLREGVRFSDDSPLTAADVVAGLQPVLPVTIQLSASGNNLVLQSATPLPDLLELLSSGRYFIYRSQPDGTLVGTGPFFVSEASSAASDGKNARYLLKASENCWAGRPFVDAIELTLGFPALRRLLDLQLGKADLIEIAPELVRRAAQENLRVWASTPVITYGLRIDASQSGASNPRLREALSYSLDRSTMANVLLQKQAEPAAALLPQWLSGYAFLFDVDTSLDRAKELRATLPPSLAAGAEPLRLRVDAPGELPKLLAERVAVNARQAGLTVQVMNRPVQREASATQPREEPAAGLHLFGWHVTSLSPRLELDSFLKALGAADSPGVDNTATDPEQLHTRERKILEDRRVLPLVALPEYAGLGAGVRNWLPARWGEWHLADVWLDVPEAAPAAVNSPVGASQRQAVPAGAKS